MLAKTKKDFTESKLLDQALKLLFMMSMKGSLSQKKYVYAASRSFCKEIYRWNNESLQSVGK